jgi:hypothetical protein
MWWVLEDPRYEFLSKKWDLCSSTVLFSLLRSSSSVGAQFLDVGVGGNQAAFRIKFWYFWKTDFGWETADWSVADWEGWWLS